VVAGALALASLPGGVARADGGDVDGRDFLVWQRGASPAAAYDAAFQGGVNVAVGDLDADGPDYVLWQQTLGSADAGPAASGSEWKYVPVRRFPAP
jgi:hypothetical protein